MMWEMVAIVITAGGGILLGLIVVLLTMGAVLADADVNIPIPQQRFLN